MLLHAQCAGTVLSALCQRKGFHQKLCQQIHLPDIRAKAVVGIFLCLIQAAKDLQKLFIVSAKLRHSAAFHHPLVKVCFRCGQGMQRTQRNMEHIPLIEVCIFRVLFLYFSRAKSFVECGIRQNEHGAGAQMVHLIFHKHLAALGNGDQKLYTFVEMGTVHIPGIILTPF